MYLEPISNVFYEEIESNAETDNLSYMLPDVLILKVIKLALISGRLLKTSALFRRCDCENVCNNCCM